MGFDNIVSKLFNKNRDKDIPELRDRRAGYFKFIAALNEGITSSSHILCDGDVSDHFVDIDMITSLTMSHYQMKTSSLDHIKPNTLFAAKSMTANGVTV
jgi:hypothetical protein